METTVRRARLDEQDAVEAMSQQDKSTKEFKYLWRRFQNWGDERSMPIVAEAEDGTLVGFHAASFGRRYVNSYYQLTLPVARGQGVGGAMVEFLIQQAHLYGSERLKFKVPPDSDGQRFWEGFGLTPCDRDEKHLLYDVSLYAVSSAKDLATADCTKPTQPKLFDGGQP